MALEMVPRARTAATLSLCLTRAEHEGAVSDSLCAFFPVTCQSCRPLLAADTIIITMAHKATTVTVLSSTTITVIREAAGTDRTGAIDQSSFVAR